MNHIPIDQNPHKNPVRKWLAVRYETEQAEEIWQRTVKNYNHQPFRYKGDLPTSASAERQVKARAARKRI